MIAFVKVISSTVFIFTESNDPFSILSTTILFTTNTSHLLINFFFSFSFFLISKRGFKLQANYTCNALFVEEKEESSSVENLEHYNAIKKFNEKHKHVVDVCSFVIGFHCFQVGSHEDFFRFIRIRKSRSVINDYVKEIHILLKETSKVLIN